MMLGALLTTLGCAYGADVLVFGDSWGTYGARPFKALMEKEGLTVDNRAIGGTTAANWASDAWKDRLKLALDDNPDAKYVWLSIGGNDAVPDLMRGRNIEEAAVDVIADTRVFLDITFDAYPDIKIVQFSYDLFDWEDNNVVCNTMGWQLSHNYCGLFPTTECKNELFENLQTLYVDEVSKYYPNHYSINMLGTLQAAAGVPGAASGSPVLSVTSPKQYMDPSCIHLTEEGYEVIFEALWNRWFAPQEAERRGVDVASLQSSDFIGSGGVSGPYRPGMYIAMTLETITNTMNAMFGWVPSWMRWR